MWSEFVFGTTPEGGKAKLCIGIEKGFLEKTLLWMVKLANEGVVQSRLPFLNEGYFEAAIVNSVGIDGNWSPNIQIVMFVPVAQCQFGLDQSLVGELEIVARSAVFSIEGVMHCRAQVELGLHVLDVGEPDIDALRLEKLSGKQVVRM